MSLYFLGIIMAIDIREELKRGTKLNDRYVIKETIGQGGFGITYRAFDTLLNGQVAIKEFFVSGSMTRDNEKSDHVRFVNDEDIDKIYKCKQSFINERNIMNELKNISFLSRIRDSFSCNGTEYIVMNLLVGQTLSQYIKKKGRHIDLKELLGPIENVLHALEQMHNLGYIHRDISPGNLFLTEYGDLYLIDFGASTNINGINEFRNNQLFQHIGYQAPEFNDVNNQGSWTDIYSLCATIFYLLTREGVPLPKDRMIHDTIPQSLLRHKLSSKQQNALIHGLQLDVSRRTQSISELCAELYSNVSLKNTADIADISFEAFTNVGSRNINQDNLLVDGQCYYEGQDFLLTGTIDYDSDKLHLAVVCDGVGGSCHGELASRAVAQACNHFINQNRNSEILLERLIDELIDQINEKIISLSKKIGKTASTISLLLWKGNQYYIANIGDSPIFLYRKKKLMCLSASQTLADKKLMEGLIPNIKDVHTLVNYLGKENVAGSQMMSYKHGFIHKGDRFILCTDGVSNKIYGNQLKHYMSKPKGKIAKSLDKVLSKQINNDNYSGVIVLFD